MFCPSTLSVSLKTSRDDSLIHCMPFSCETAVECGGLHTQVITAASTVPTRKMSLQ
jgi:hypothetical protein